MPVYRLYFWSPKSGLLEREHQSRDQPTTDMLERIDDAGRRALGLIGHKPSMRGAGHAATLPVRDMTKLETALHHLRHAVSLLDQAGEQDAAYVAHRLHDVLETTSGHPPRSQH